MTNTEARDCPATTEQGCLDENQLLAFCQGNGSSPPPHLIEHLDVCAGCRISLSAAAMPERANRERRSSPVAASFAAGDIVAGRYRIERFLGAGGMGEVYEATDALLETRIALKTVLTAISDDRQALLRLKKEVQMARRVTHPNVCRLFDVGVHDDERSVQGTGASVLPFITMELLDGETLGQRVRRLGRLDAAQALAVLEPLVAGLTAAHRAGVILRDLKPDNVMLARVPGAPERLAITDFGLARLAATERTAESLSAPGSVLGTMAYMAPEQINGAPVTAAADIYSLGVVMYETITGILPFADRAQTPVGAVLMRLGQSPTPPSKLVATLVPRWDAVIARCLSPDPALRFASAEDVLCCLRADSIRSRLSRLCAAVIRTGAKPKVHRLIT